MAKGETLQQKVSNYCHKSFSRMPVHHTTPRIILNFLNDGASRYFGLWLWILVHSLTIPTTKHILLIPFLQSAKDYLLRWTKAQLFNGRLSLITNTLKLNYEIEFDVSLIDAPEFTLSSLFTKLGPLIGFSANASPQIKWKFSITLN